jgi:hypothetical protein
MPARKTADIATEGNRFDATAVSQLAEPVRRYLAHALRDGGRLDEHVELSMEGHVKVGAWLSFSARQEFHGHNFAWRARAGFGPVKPLQVIDRYSDGRGSTEGRLFGRFPFMHADDENTTRAAAARGAAESIWVPASLLPVRGACWRAAAEDHIVVTVSVPPEKPEVHLRIDERGAVRSVCVQRWGNVGQADYGYIPFGGEVAAEGRFGDTVIPTALEVGWWYGTPRYNPFFRATISNAVPLG